MSFSIAQLPFNDKALSWWSHFSVKEWRYFTFSRFGWVSCHI